MMWSDVDHSDQVGQLMLVKRILYSLFLASAVSAGFLLCMGVAFLIGLALDRLTFSDPMSPAEALASIILPIGLSFTIALGFARNPSKAHIVPGSTIKEHALKAARRGIVHGLIFGCIFAVIWSSIFEVLPVIEFPWREVRAGFIESTLFVMVMLVLANVPTLAVFRAFTSVIDDLILNIVSGSRPERHSADS